MASGDLYNQLAGELRAEMRSLLPVVGAFVEDRVVRRAPHVSGQLQRAISVSPFQERFDSYHAKLAVDDQAAPHGKWTNEGTGVYVGRGRIYGQPAPPPPGRTRPLAFFWLKLGRDVVFVSVAGQPGQHWFEGPDGTALETDLSDACAAAFGVS